MNKEWILAVEKYAYQNNMVVDRAHQLAVILWFSANVGPVAGFDAEKYQGFQLVLEGKKPYKGRWAKSETKTKGTSRPPDDPTCYKFEEFWKDFGYAKGSKRDAEVIWNKLPETIRAAIQIALPSYVQSTTTSDKKEKPFKPKRLYPTSYLNGGVWTNHVEKLEIGGEQMNMDVLDGIFAKLDVSTGYMIAPDRQDLIRALGEFDTSVGGYVERHLISALQDHYTEKGKFAGKLADVLRSQDFRTSYLSRI